MNSEATSKVRRIQFAVVPLVLFLMADNWRFALNTFAPQYSSETFRNLSAWSKIEIHAIVWVGLSAVGILAVHRMDFMVVIRELGLTGSVGPAILFALVATAPMWLGFPSTLKMNPHVSLASMFHLAVVSPFAEKVLYRGYLFRQLHRRAEFGFIIAVIVTAVLFGLGHYSDAARAEGVWNVIGIVTITGLGGAFFAWLFVRWQDNLWVPFGMHCFMNLWWEVFAVDATALGGWLANAVRLLTVALAIMLTLNRKRLWKIKAA